MLAFLVPVRHPANAVNYAEIEQLLRETLTSLTATRDAEYKVYVCCSQAMADYEHPNVVFHEVDFPIPGQGKGSKQTYEDFQRDKSTKVFTGLIRAKDEGADRFMIVDADDFVHRDLANFCAGDPAESGWFIDHGLTWRHGGGVVADRREFWSICGTSHVVQMKAAEEYLDPSLTPFSSQDEIMEKVPHDFRVDVLGSHRRVQDFFKKRGAPMNSVPFAAAVWRTGSAESHSGIRFADRPRVASKAEIENFSLPIKGSGAARIQARMTELPQFWARHVARKVLRR